MHVRTHAHTHTLPETSIHMANIYWQAGISFFKSGFPKSDPFLDMEIETYGKGSAVIAK